MKERSVDCERLVVSDDEAPEVSKPGERALDLPAAFVASKPASVLERRPCSVFAVRGDEVDPLGPEAFAQGVAVGCLVVDQAIGLPPRSPATLPWNLHVRERFLDERDLRGRGRRQAKSQRNTFAIRHHQTLRSLAPLGFSDGGAPFFAAKKLASAKLSSQSSQPRSSSSARNFRQTFSQVPSSSQRFKRRQQVLGLGRSAGRSLQRAPVFRTQRIPSKTSRVSAQGRPPLRLWGSSGNNGSSFPHIASVTNLSRRAIGLYLRLVYIVQKSVRI